MTTGLAYLDQTQTRRTLAILLISVVVIKVLLLWVIVPLAKTYGLVPNTVGTARDLYFDIARSIVSGHGFQVMPESAQTMMRGPTYVLFLSGIHLLFGESIVFAQIANLLCGLGSICIVFLLTKRLTGSNICAVFAGLIVAFHPSILVMETRINVESFFVLLLCIFVYLLFRAFEKRTLPAFFLAGLSLGVVVLTRSSPVVIIPLIFVFLLLRDGSIRSSLRSASTSIVVLAAGTMLVVSPWMARNHALSGKATFSENLMGIVTYQSQYVTMTTSSGLGYQERIQAARKLQSELAAENGVSFRRFERDPYWDVFPTIEDELRYNEVLVGEAVRNYVEDPLLFVKHCALNSLRFWFQGATPMITAVGMPIMLAMLALAIAGAIIAIRKRLPVAPLFLVIMTVYAVHVPLISHARYSVPLIPMLAILAGIALSQTRLGRSPANQSADPAQ